MSVFRSWDSLLVEHWTCDWKIVSSNPNRSGRRMLFSWVNCLCFGVSSTPVLLQWHVKHPGYSAKSAGDRLQLNTYTLDPKKSEWADYAAVQTQCENLLGNELTHNSSGNTQPQSSQFSEPLWTDPGLKIGISVRNLISTKKKKKCTGGEWIAEHSPQILTCEKKATTTMWVFHLIRKLIIGTRINLVVVLHWWSDVGGGFESIWISLYRILQCYSIITVCLEFLTHNCNYTNSHKHQTKNDDNTEDYSQAAWWEQGCCSVSQRSLPGSAAAEW